MTFKTAFVAGAAGRLDRNYGPLHRTTGSAVRAKEGR
jgi:hypothetical protein